MMKLFTLSSSLRNVYQFNRIYFIIHSNLWHYKLNYSDYTNLFFFSFNKLYLGTSFSFSVWLSQVIIPRTVTIEQVGLYLELWWRWNYKD